jgi:hypothetical protein
MNIIGHKLTEIKLDGGLLFGGENGQETQDGFIHPFISIIP